ncbi:MAG: polymerase, sigma-24 subunit, subfamily [Chloroflexi bacterium]|nr:polymerase, sigma-24 subunit, subfamily [Chloroflexota bacterium]
MELTGGVGKAATSGPDAATARPAEPPSTRPAEAPAFEASVAPHWANLVRRLVLVLGDRAMAEDVAQDAYLRAFRAWDRFDGSDARAWLYTIALRLAFNEQRRHRRWLAAVRRVEPRPWAGPSDPDLWAALGRLDTRTRAALLLSAVDGYSQREIAAMLAVPEGTVASWLSRGRAALRHDLGDDPGR